MSEKGDQPPPIQKPAPPGPTPVVSTVDAKYSSAHKAHLTKLQYVFNRLNRIHGLGKSALSNPSRLAYFLATAKEAKNYYEKFNVLWDANIELHSSFDLLASFPPDEDLKLMEDIDTCYLEILYFEETAQKATRASQPQGRSSISAEGSQMIETGARHRLPKINLVKFSGDFTQWPLFRDSFKSMVSDPEVGLSDIEKFHHLISSLEGPALQLIKDIPVSASQYGRAWQVIMDNYDNKRLLSNHYLSKVIDFKPHTGKPTVASLKGFLTTIGESIAAYNRLEIPSSEEHLLFTLAIRGLDPHTRQAFERKHVTVTFPTFKELEKFVKEECRTLELASGNPEGQSQKSTNLHKDRGSRSSLLVNKESKGNNSPSQGETNRGKACPVCKNAHHTLLKCDKFRRFSPHERFKAIKNWFGCKLCLDSSHGTQKCESANRCAKCEKRHHTWLHLSTENSNTQAGSAPPTEQPASVLLGGTTHPVDVLLGTILLKILDSKGHLQSARAVVDGGSEFSFMTDACQRRLGLKSKSFNKSISGLGDSHLCETKGMVECVIHSPSAEYVTNAVVVTDITGYLPHCSLPPAYTNKLKGFLLADPSFNEPGPIEFLLGADLFYEILVGSPITVCENMPKLVPTTFGYVVAGRCERKSAGRVFLAKQSSELCEIMSKFWTIEEVGDGQIVSKEDDFCETFYKDTTYRTDTGRYVVALPFKNPPLPDLSSSRMLAVKRFRNIESKLAKCPEFGQAYKDFMKEYESLQHMEIAKHPAKFVIPHHGVWKSGKPSGKIRVVFDGSCHTRNGALNDHLLAGPKLQRGVDEVILRFRRHPVVFSADIVKHYRQILVRPEDRPYQHIIWRAGPDDDLKEYQLNTITYGLSCSPWLALRTVKQLVEDEGAHFPAAAEILSHDIFVDDIVTGCSTVAEAFIIKEQLTSMLAKGGFALSKWTSNCQQLLKDIDSTISQPLQFDNEGDSFIKILGLQWDPSEDSFRYKIAPPVVSSTKRGVSSAIARIYDPLGYLSPVVFNAKVLLQACWQCKVDWDEAIPKEIETPWRAFLADLPSLNDLKIPRQIPSYDAVKIQIVGFCDGSQKGFSASIYIRLELVDRVEIHLLKAKTGVAPIRPLTIPRLELQAALLLSRLFVSIHDYVNQMEVNEFYWFSDSTLVLGWLKTPPHLLKTYVGHRIVRITDRTDINDWYHVASPDNPADCSSRGILPSEILNHPLWFHGPPWLYNDPSLWPARAAAEVEPITDSTELRAAATSIMAITQTSILISWMDRVSSHGKLVRIMVYVLRALNVMVSWPKDSSNRRSIKCWRAERKISDKNSSAAKDPDPISAVEYQSANLVFIKIVQHHFIIKAHVKAADLQTIPCLRRLSCFYDSHGIIRVGGRIQESNLSPESKHPIVLPGNCHFTRILINSTHQRFYHMSPKALQCLLQLNYWILSARTVIKQQLHRCIVCVKASKHHPSPKMGNLPKPRVDDTGVWQNVGVDYAGPFMVKFSNHRKGACSKAYLCLFVCMATKALHLELVSDCSTEAFLATLDRFIGRRGLPQHIFSDCGKNFVGASKQLRELHTWISSRDVQGSVQEHLAPMGIQWSFNPPYAPNFGGLWEAGVKSAKTILYKVSGDTTWTFEELTTLFVRIEAILNSRPLTPLSNDPTDLSYLTPGHFLIGRPLLARPESDIKGIPMNRLRRWQLVQRQVQHFWQRWRMEYLQHLQVRVKWNKDEPNVTEGTMVVLRDDNVPPLQWQLGRITKTFPGKDQTVRVVEVLTPSGRYTRKVSQIISLKSVTDPSPN